MAAQPTPNNDDVDDLLTKGSVAKFRNAIDRGLGALLLPCKKPIVFKCRHVLKVLYGRSPASTAEPSAAVERTNVFLLRDGNGECICSNFDDATIYPCEYPNHGDAILLMGTGLVFLRDGTSWLEIAEFQVVSPTIPLARPIRGVEPDVTIVVNGTEFQHYSVLLCLSSEYFDAMFANDMKEKREKRVVFPDKDPEEWKVVASFFEPHVLPNSGPQVTGANVQMLLPWFQELVVPELLQHCKLVYHKHVKDVLSKSWCTLFDAFDYCELHMLEKTTPLCWELVKQNLQSDSKSLTTHDILRFKQFLIREEAAPIWACLFERRLLPQSLLSVDRTLLLKNRLFHHVLRARITTNPSELSDDEGLREIQ
jgi:hypothetical protein